MGASNYECRFGALISGWRRRFSAAGSTRADAPFLFVQLAPWSDPWVGAGAQDSYPRFVSQILYRADSARSQSAAWPHPPRPRAAAQGVAKCPAEGDSGGDPAGAPLLRLAQACALVLILPS